MKTRINPRAQRVLFESLEPRSLLSAAPATQPPLLFASAPAVLAADTVAVNDIGVSVASVTLPSAFRLGDSPLPSGTATVTLTNAGNVATAIGATVDVSLRLRLTTSASSADDVVLSSFTQVIGSLSAGGSVILVRDVALSSDIEAILADGTYRIVALAVPAPAIGDSNAANDSATASGYTLKITGQKDVSAAITTVTLPASIRAGQTLSGIVAVDITNEGLSATPVGATIDLSIRIRLTSASNSDNDIVLASLVGFDIGNLAAGASKTVTVGANPFFNVTLPGNLPGGSYKVVVVSTPSALVADGDSSNNSKTSAYTLGITGPDLTVTLGAITHPTAYIQGIAAAGFVSFTVTNAGTTTIAPTALVDLEITFAPSEGGNAIRLYYLRGVRVGGMAAGASKTFKLAVNIPRTVPANTYQFVAEVDPLNRLAETSETNNTSKSTTQYTLMQPNVDLTAAMFRPAFPLPVPANSPYKTSLSISVINAGNVFIPLGTKINMRIELRLVDEQGNASGPDLFTTPVVILNKAIGKLAAGRAIVTTVKTTLPALAAGNYRFVAIVDTANSLTTESSELNNTADSVDFRVG